MKSTPNTRYTLIGKLRNPQDIEAWEEFSAIYQPLIFRMCRAKGLQHADATDVTQDVLTRVAKAIESFDHEQQGATFRGWLFRITRNLVTDFFRKRSANPTVQAESTLHLIADVEPNRAEAAEFQTEYQRQMFWVVAKDVKLQVKEATWLAFQKTELEQQSVDQVAKDLRMSKGAVYVARSRVIARFKKEVERRTNETCEFFI